MLTLYPFFLAQILCFQEVAELTLENSPQLQIQADLVGKRIGDHLQAKVIPNPVFTYTVENVLGTNEWQGWRDAKEEYDLTQAIETGGKRRYRSIAAGLAVTEAEQQLEVSRLVVLNRLKKLFIETAGLQELLQLADEKAANGEEIVRNLENQVAEGKISPIQLQKVKIELANALFLKEKVKGDLQQVREELALEWGGPYPDFDAVFFDLYNLESPYTCAQSELGNHPLLLQWEYRRRGMEETVNYQKSLSIPDVFFTVGYKTEQKNKGFVFELSFPLPFFDRNQGNILKAEFDEQSAITELTANQTRLQTQMRTAIKQTARNFKEAIYLRDSILKSAEDAYSLSSEGYQQGKYPHLDVLNAHQTLFDIQEQFINALVRTHASQVDIDYLIPPNVVKGNP